MTRTATTKKPNAKARKRPVVSRRNCSICRKTGAETFWFMRRNFVFDVDKAREITSDGRPTLLLDRDDMRFAVDTSRIHDDHVPHVKLCYPGIVARLRFTKRDGEVVEGDVLIDGHHRAARALQLGKPFSVRLLTVEETDSIMIRRPDAPPAAE